MRITVLAVFAALALPARAASAQCPDGTPPPCRGAAARPGTAAIDSHVIAVLPFRVSGADTSLAEGLAELLAVEFTGEGAPRSADMGTVLRAWRAAGGGARVPLELASAQRMASRVGAGQILTASLVATGQRLSLSAQVTGTSSGAVTARAGPVRGNLDSLPDLLHEIAGQLIAMPANGGGGLSGVSTDALRAYMAARAAYRRSEWADAARLFERALQIDSTFAYAAVGRLRSEGWTTLPPTDLPRIRRLAWSYRDRLDPVNRALLLALLGRHYPDRNTVLEALESWAEVTRLAPDNADAWFALGDEFAHRGALVAPDGLARARVALERALAVDPGLSEAALHLSTIGMMSGDLELTRRYNPLARRLAPNTAWIALVGLEGAMAEGRGKRVSDSLIGVMATLDPTALNLVAVFSTLPDYADTAFIEAGFVERARRATSAADRRQVALTRSRWLYNRGRPAAADRELAQLDAGEAAYVRILNAAFSGGDESIATAAVAAWSERPPGDTLRARDQCLLGMWWLQRGDTAAAARQSAVLRGEGRTSTDVAAWCNPLIEAGLAIGQRRADAPALLARADSIIAQGMPSIAGWEGLALGRMWAALGDWPAAVRAVRRREWFGSSRTGSGAHQSERFRAEGRWAALAGDTTGARTAYRRYLWARAFPEPSRVAQRDSVLAEQAALSRP